MRNYKKALAGVLAATMVLGSSFAALAADQTATAEGQGKADIPEKSDVFDLTFPTSAEGVAAFTYILDPKGVITKTGAEKYGNAEFTPGHTVYFANRATATSGNSALTYSNTSDSLTVVNKSSVNVNVTVEAQIAESEKITMAESNQFQTSDTSASLYLALTDNAGSTPTAITTSGIEVTKPITGTPANFDVSYNSSNGKYEYAMITGKTDADFQSYSFQLTGACNPNGVWDGITDTDAPNVTVTWSVADPTIAPQTYVSTTSISPTSNRVTVTLPTGVTVSGITLRKTSTASPVTMVANNHYTLTGNTYAFTPAMVGNWKGGTLTFAYSNNKTEIVTIP